AGEWLIANQIFRPGDWSVLNPGLEPGGWAFEFANDWFPDVDDSAVILMVLAQLPIAQTPSGKRAIAYGLNWTLGMQSRSGRWGANVITVTRSVLDGVAAIGEDLRAPYVRRAVEWLRARQNAGGGWGETVASYDDESLAGKGESTASQTAWALLGLMAADGAA